MANELHVRQGSICKAHVAQHEGCDGKWAAEREDKMDAPRPQTEAKTVPPLLSLGLQ